MSPLTRLRSVLVYFLPLTLLPAPPAMAAGANDARLEALDKKIDALRRAYEETPWPADTPEAIAALLKHDPGACAGFVRRGLRYEPYAGVLRGGRGALASGGGNSADLCLLLHDMLAGASPKPEMRFAVAELAEAQARELVRRATGSAPARPAAASDASVQKPEIPPAGDLPKPPHSTARHRRELLADVNVAAARIESALADSIPKPGDPLPAAVRAARTHVWLQVRKPDGAWLSLDPAGGLPLPGNARQLERLPGDWNHTVALKVEVERLGGGKLARDVVLERTWPSAALEGRAVELMIVPAELSVPKMIDVAAGDTGTFLEQARGFKRFGTILTVPGEKPQEGSGFGLDGRPLAAPAKPGPTGVVAIDPFKRLPGGGGRGAPRGADGAPPSDLAGVWLTLTVKSPGAAPATVERALLDRIGPDARARAALRIAGTWQAPPRMAVALLQRHQVLVSTGAIGTVRSGRATIEAALLEQPLLQRSIALEGTADAKALDEAMKQITPPSFPSDLIAVNDASLALAGARLMGKGACYVATPNLYVRGESLDLAPDGSVVSRRVIDVARHELAVLADPARVWRTRLLHGLAASELEGRVLDDDENPARSAARSLRDAELVPVRTAGDMKSSSEPADVRATMAKDLRDGAVLLAPAKPTAGGAWWRVSREGHVIAVAADGRGQAATEGGMILTDVSIPQVKNCMTFVACLNKGVAGGGAMVQTAANCWAEQVKDVVKDTLDSALEQMIGDPFEDLFEGEDGDEPDPEPGTITHLRDAPFQEPDEQSYYELYQEAREALDDLKERAGQIQAAVEDPLGQLPGMAEGSAAADAGEEIGNALGTRMYLLLAMGHDIAKFASRPIAE